MDLGLHRGDPTVPIETKNESEISQQSTKIKANRLRVRENAITNSFSTHNVIAELKKFQVDNKIVLLEVNPRPSGSIATAYPAKIPIFSYAIAKTLNKNYKMPNPKFNIKVRL